MVFNFASRPLVAGLKLEVFGPCITELVLADEIELFTHVRIRLNKRATASFG